MIRLEQCTTNAMIHGIPHRNGIGEAFNLFEHIFVMKRNEFERWMDVDDNVEHDEI